MCPAHGPVGLSYQQTDVIARCIDQKQEATIGDMDGNQCVLRTEAPPMFWSGGTPLNQARPSTRFRVRSKSRPGFNFSPSLYQVSLDTWSICLLRFQGLGIDTGALRPRPALSGLEVPYGAHIPTYLGSHLYKKTGRPSFVKLTGYDKVHSWSNSLYSSKKMLSSTGRYVFSPDELLIFGSTGFDWLIFHWCIHSLLPT